MKIIIVLVFSFLAFINTIYAQPFTGCPTGDEVVNSSQATLEQDLFDKVDQVRQDTFGLPPLTRCTILDYACRYHCLDMKTDGYFCHSTNDPVGSDACFGYTNLTTQCDRDTRIRQFVGTGVYNNNEALALGYTTAEDVVNAWLNEPSHRGILASSYTHGGVGVVSNTGGGYYWNLNMADAVCCEHDTTDATSSICDGDSILLGGSYQTTAGTYYDELTTDEGCDSVVATDLSVLSSDTLTWTGSVNTDWNSTGNWDMGVVPDICNPVIIPNTSNKPIISTAGMKCKNITINTTDGAYVIINTSGTLEVAD